MITPDKITRGKYWYFPKAKTDTNTNRIEMEKVSQQKFFCEYHPTGHAIYSDIHFKNIPILGKTGNILGYHSVNRVSLPIQQMSLEIVVPHLLGNHTQFRENTSGQGNSDITSWYKQRWDEKNLEVAFYELVFASMAVGDAALLFYKVENELKWKSLSYLLGEEIYSIDDKYGDMSQFVRFYTTLDENAQSVRMCDCIDKTNIITYKENGSEWVEVSTTQHGFNYIPVVYHRRREGAYWTSVQGNIDEVEKNMSRLSEDNRAKAKSRFHLATKDPNNVQTASVGSYDMVITETDGKFSLINGADISTQFKYEYETTMEAIFNKLGIVFVKSKSSGDMPVGSMKLLFFPTERVCRNLEKEYNATLDILNTVFKKGIIYEYPEKVNELKGIRLSASIKTFTPQDDNSYNAMLGQMKNYGILSTQTASENTTISTNDEFARIKTEEQAEIAQTALTT